MDRTPVTREGLRTDEQTTAGQSIDLHDESEDGLAASLLDSIDAAAEQLPDRVGRGAAALVVQLDPGNEGRIDVDYRARSWFPPTEMAAVLRMVLTRLEDGNT